VFVKGVKGPEPRAVVLGLNDWDRSEVVSGLEAGEEVILISVARLRQQQEELLDRVRQRNTGPIPGAPGGGPGGGRR
jgi:HlyD family secretion protein